MTDMCLDSGDFLTFKEWLKEAGREKVFKDKSDEEMKQLFSAVSLLYKHFGQNFLLGKRSFLYEKEADCLRARLKGFKKDYQIVTEDFKISLRLSVNVMSRKRKKHVRKISQSLLGVLDSEIKI